MTSFLISTARYKSWSPLFKNKNCKGSSSKIFNFPYQLLFFNSKIVTDSSFINFKMLKKKWKIPIFKLLVLFDQLSKPKNIEFTECIKQTERIRFERTNLEGG